MVFVFPEYPNSWPESEELIKRAPPCNLRTSLSRRPSIHSDALSRSRAEQADEHSFLTRRDGMKFPVRLPMLLIGFGVWIGQSYPCWTLRSGSTSFGHRNRERPSSHSPRVQLSATRNAQSDGRAVCQPPLPTDVSSWEVNLGLSLEGASAWELRGLDTGMPEQAPPLRPLDPSDLYWGLPQERRNRTAREASIGRSELLGSARPRSRASSAPPRVECRQPA
jgi:hypothetical protein